MTIAPQVRVGVGVFILECIDGPPANPRFLIGKRINSHGSGTYSLPGGHLEFGETLEECASRELLEETGLKSSNLKFLTATNDYMPAEGKHYVTIWMTCVREDESQPPQLLEPNKCEGWEWVSWKELKSWAGNNIEGSLGEGNPLARTLFLPFLNLLQQRPNITPAVIQGQQE
ncbi:NUDIX hydrolase domain-like protein [Talaromyces proteolyticus]|uniref:NUDIX hydrolase domain-like protein n=1 Tax=Talaromyces proteolyticus TaxID=1131652 RepID=A0AAD4Q150_9EURO|nr:NUDIX hydrolase domain-like protein [Talaromyces proteolyticus]KAH8697951.1 NUDIX hydrolase domain-like protein [Talaromyces proteolyticus]